MTTTPGGFADGWTPPALAPFHWHTYDVGSVLPAGWREELLSLAAAESVRHDFRPTMSSARERTGTVIRLETVNGETLQQRAPWLERLYLGWFRALAERTIGEALHPTSTANRSLSLNVLRGDGERYPCHVDSNPAQGLLYLTDCTEETGGGLVVARDRTARDVAEVDRDAGVIYPRAGQLYFFDARAHAHYVQPMRDPDGLRAVVTMNYYSQSCPESVRPTGLDDQLFAAAAAR
ncbi:2OG-Fe(II) oxygenase [Kitasatospora cineracea]|uniref:2-oxoglutarate-Fe(II)-dependent oxygenase superfamily protein n=1 Tax=Kitasatospora cineracea TaxID=88074 RepID=A0A3N4R0R7_9ACTN|nr:2OG-Fe(II) oxygenase [Kitasatospora cineracea]RPE26908.1 2-oxoglutarate-Fe(II)-dependent oxygenase superfamily protein [Kitasatospora cineracea]